MTKPTKPYWQKVIFGLLLIPFMAIGFAVFLIWSSVRCGYEMGENWMIDKPPTP